MLNSYINDPIIDVAATSPLADQHDPTNYAGPHGSSGIELEERFGQSICDLTAWPKLENKTITAVKKSTSVQLTAEPNGGLVEETVQAFQYAPRRWTIISGVRTLPTTLHETVGENATIVDLSHGRTIIRISGSKVEWVLSKLFAIDFHIEKFPINNGLATKHHEMLTQIQRIDEDAFDLIVFRSLAQSFWLALLKASEEVGYSIK